MLGPLDMAVPFLSLGATPLRRAGVLLGVTTAFFGLLMIAIRPWYCSWGSSAEEQHARPAVAMSRGLELREVRAIPVEAPAEQVFAGRAQLGQDRAGFYS